MIWQHLRSRLDAPIRLPNETWRRNQYAVLVAVFISFLGFNFVLPFLPLFVRELGVSDVGQVAFLSGVGIAVAPFFSGIAAPFWGALADRVGVKLMVQRALLSFAVLNALTSLVTEPWQLIVLRAGVGILGAFGTLAASMITIGTPQGQVGSAIGRLQASQLLATAIGPLIGGVVADRFGIRTSFVVSASLCFVAFVLITVLFRDDRASSEGRREAPIPARRLLTMPIFLSLVGILLLAQFVDRGFGPILPLFVAELDPGVPVASTAGLIFAAGSLVAAIAASQAGRLIVRHGVVRLLPISLFIGVVVVLPIAVVDQIWHLAALRIALGLATGMVATVVYTATTQVVPQHSRTTAFGFLGSAHSLANALGPFGSGAIAAVSLRAVFVADAVVYAVAIGLALGLARVLAPVEGKPRLGKDAG